MLNYKNPNTTKYLKTKRPDFRQTFSAYFNLDYNKASKLSAYVCFGATPTCFPTTSPL